ncbi:hypothetical protein [Streptomyces stelliscabiei]|uniref:hypothetical protein n=1 Tax=Streptomyces stelliscabiei TaxID=146820 RepID=UPI003A8E4FA2
MMATTATGLTAGRLPGLHTLPDDLGWVVARPAWLPVFALALLLCRAAFHSYENRRPRTREGSRVVRVQRRPDGTRPSRNAETEAVPHA